MSKTNVTTIQGEDYGSPCENLSIECSGDGIITTKKRKSQQQLLNNLNNIIPNPQKAELLHKLSNIYKMYLPRANIKHPKKGKCKIKKQTGRSPGGRYSEFYLRKEKEAPPQCKQRTPILPPIPLPSYNLSYKSCGGGQHQPANKCPDVMYKGVLGRQQSAKDPDIFPGGVYMGGEYQSKSHRDGRNSGDMNTQKPYSSNYINTQGNYATDLPPQSSINVNSEDNREENKFSYPESREKIEREDNSNINMNMNIIEKDVTDTESKYNTPEKIESENNIESEERKDSEQIKSPICSRNIQSTENSPQKPTTNICKSLSTSNSKTHMKGGPSAKFDNNELMVIDEVQDRASKAEKERLRREFEKRNLEHLRLLTQKKKEELLLLEQERNKMLAAREKIKNLVLNRATKMSGVTSISTNTNINITNINSKYNEDKYVINSVNPLTLSSGDNSNSNNSKIQDKTEQATLRKFFRSRYATLLATLKENSKSKALEEEKEKRRQEKIKTKLKEDIGADKVESKYRYENANSPLVNKYKCSPEGLRKSQKKNVNNEYAGSSNTSTTATSKYTTVHQPPKTITNFKQIYNSPGTTVKTFNPKTPEKGEDGEDAKEKEKKRLQKEAADQIVRRQQKYIQELQTKKDKEALTEMEKLNKEKKKQQMVRETVKAIAKEVKTSNSNPFNYQDREKERRQAQNEKLDKKEKIMSKEDFAELLKRHKPKLNPNAYVITDFSEWRKRYKIHPRTKVFVMSAGYSDMRNALKRRGWVENDDINSPCFDLKWVLKARDIDHSSLQEFQIVNHFPKNAEITTKIGLCHNLKNLIWYNNVDIDIFFPRCFDLKDNAELDDFIVDFKLQKAESILKIFKISEGDLNSVGGENRLLIALGVCERNCKDLDEILESSNPELNLAISGDEWNILNHQEVDDISLKTMKRLNNRGNKSNTDEHNPQVKNVDEEILAEAESCSEKDKLLIRAENVLDQLENKFPQFALNGHRNMWIIKPAGKSRGRGIHVFNSLNDILDYTKGKDKDWVAQKYIENSLIISNRKFDIRQWVLVTSWNPLKIWFFNSPYIRFGAQDYTVDAKKLNNRLIHLTNNSVTKYSKDPQIGSGNMWDSQTFSAYLEKTYGYDVFEEQLLPNMKKLVIWSLESVQESVVNSSNSCEMYGYDFMVDTELNPWLIEVNSSPAMDYSTEVTEKLVKLVGEDTCKVIVDYHFANKKRRPKIDTGLWELIHHSKKCQKPQNAFGLNLLCEGKKITKLHLI